MDDNDLKLQSYQDDLNEDDNAIDPLMDEQSENPAEEIGIPEDEYTEGLAGIDFGDHNETDDNDDRREQLEDLEEDDSNNAMPGVPS